MQNSLYRENFLNFKAERNRRFLTNRTELILSSYKIYRHGNSIYVKSLKSSRNVTVVTQHENLQIYPISLPLTSET